MGHLLPQLTRRPAHRVLHPVMAHHMAPSSQSALGAEQLLQPLVAEREDGVGVDQQFGLGGLNAPLGELLGAEQVQEIAFAAPGQQMIGMGRAEQLSVAGSAPAARAGVGRGAWLSHNNPVVEGCEHELSCGATSAP